MRKKIIQIFLLYFVVSAYIMAASFPTIPNTFAPRQIISSTKINENYNALLNGITDGANKINVNQVYINSNLVLDNDLSAKVNNFQATGNSIIDGNHDVYGNESVYGVLNVTGDLNLTGNFTGSFTNWTSDRITANTSIYTPVFINDHITSNSSIYTAVLGGSTINMVSAVVTHPFTSLYPSTNFGIIRPGQPSGGLSLTGLSNYAAGGGIFLNGYAYDTASVAGSSTGVFLFNGHKYDGGTGATGLDNDEILASWANNNTVVAQIEGNGAMNAEGGFATAESLSHPVKWKIISGNLDAGSPMDIAHGLGYMQIISVEGSAFEAGNSKRYVLGAVGRDSANSWFDLVYIDATNISVSWGSDLNNDPYIIKITYN